MKIRSLALVAAAALIGAACGEAPSDTQAAPTDAATSPTEDAGATETEAGGDVLACQVTDTGGVDDRSFNQTAFAGLERAEEELGAEIAVLESTSPSDFEPNINAFIERGCDLIVTVGFLLGDATAAAAEANPDQEFAIVDFAFEEEIPNVRGLVFSTDQAAFLAGYLAAGMTESGKVGTFGGINIPPVTIFMDGFAEGIDHHNAEKGTEVELLGWDPESQDGLFTGDFENQDNGRRTAETLINNGADIIMPVAGPVGLGSAAAAEAAGDVSLIWVDTDGCESAAEFCDLFLTSVMKNMDVAVFDSVQQVVDGTFDGGLFVGTLENDGVGIAPFHEFEDEVPDELKSEIEQLREAIVAGDLQVGEGG